MALFFFFLGAAMGSFLNVVALRTLQGESWVLPPSRCPGCRTRLGFAERLPLAGYLLLGGRCRHCRRPIPLRYPAMELGTGLFYALLWVRLPTPGAALQAMALYSLLLVVCLLERDGGTPGSLLTALTLGAVLPGLWVLPLSPVRFFLRGALGLAAVYLCARGSRRVLPVESPDSRAAYLLGVSVGFPAVCLLLLIAFAAGTIRCIMGSSRTTMLPSGTDPLLLLFSAALLRLL